MTLTSVNAKSPEAAHSGDGRVNLQILDPTARPDWDDLLATHPDATFFHTAAWAQTLVEAYGCACRYVALVGEKQLYGFLPVIETSNWFRGAGAVSLPFTDECSPLVSSRVSAPELFAAALREGEARRWKYLELRGGRDLFGDFPEAVNYYEHVLSLQGPVDQLFETFASPVRRALRKSSRCGVTVEFGTDLEFVRTYYRLHCRTRTKHGSPPQPFAFFRSLCRNILEKGRGFVALAMHEGRPVAGAVFFRFGARAVYKFSASDDRHQGVRGTNLVIWEAIRRLVQMGITSLNFGRTSLSNEGLRRFKCGWGAEERLISYMRYSFPRHGFVKTADWAAGAPARVLALLPGFLSRWIGRAVYSQMSCGLVS